MTGDLRHLDRVRSLPTELSIEEVSDIINALPSLVLRVPNRKLYLKQILVLAIIVTVTLLVFKDSGEMKPSGPIKEIVLPTYAPDSIHVTTEESAQSQGNVTVEPQSVQTESKINAKTPTAPTVEIEEIKPKAEVKFISPTPKNESIIDEYNPVHDTLNLDSLHDDCTCDCQCDQEDVLRYSQHLNTGFMSFYFNCANDDENGVIIERNELKDLKKDLWKELKKQNKLGLNHSAEIAFEPAIIRLNGKETSRDNEAIITDILANYGIGPAQNRKVLIGKDQIWIGDFKDGTFSGAASGFNIKESLANPYIYESAEHH